MTDNKRRNNMIHSMVVVAALVLRFVVNYDYLPTLQIAAVKFGRGILFFSSKLALYFRIRCISHTNNLYSAVIFAHKRRYESCFYILKIALAINFFTYLYIFLCE